MSVFWVYSSSDLGGPNHAMQLDAGLSTDLQIEFMKTSTVPFASPVTALTAVTPLSV